MTLPAVENFSESSPFDALRTKAEQEVRVGETRRRPTWAPQLTLGDELTDLCRKLELLKPDDPPVARLWAEWKDPRRTDGVAICWGFELCPGIEKRGPGRWHLFQTLCREGSVAEERWWCGPKWHEPPSVEKCIERYGYDAEAAWRERYKLRVRATELSAQRVIEFAGDPDAQLRIAGRLTGRCGMCGKGMFDPISLERGIGPECWGRYCR
jgi:Family of unknown function (DUF6011)